VRSDCLHFLCFYFQITNVKFFRESQVYRKYFDMMDKSGGFMLYRWGDAHTRGSGLAIIADFDKLYSFRDKIGYRHKGNQLSKLKK